LNALAFPSKFDANRCAAFIEAVAGGASRSKAAKTIGITMPTFYEWLHRGERGEAPFDAFAQAVELAERSARQAKLDAIRASLRPRVAA
jgi:transposase